MDVLFGGYEMGTSPQKLYENCDLEAIAGDALTVKTLQLDGKVQSASHAQYYVAGLSRLML